MRFLAIGLLLLAACDRDSAAPSPEIAARPAAIAFDGFDYSTEAAKRAHGERLTYVLGCRGCHGKDLKGQLWDDDPREYGVMWASNLTRAIPGMSDAQLAGLLTGGVHPKRAEMWVMPSELFQHLSRPDLDALVAYLRGVPPQGESSPDPRPGPVALRQIKSGEIRNAAAMVRERKSVAPIDLGPAHELGRYITRVTCAECHGPELKGTPGDTPDLIVAGGYSRAEFEALMTKGALPNHRKFKDPLMGEVARNRFSRLTPHEREALYAYLRARAEEPQ